MLSRCCAALLGVLFVVRPLSAHRCAPCSLRTCPVRAAHGCEGGRTLARDPCGCCDQCSRLEWEPCGGRDWAHGYCALGLSCASVNRSGAAVIPEVGVCKGRWRSSIPNITPGLITAAPPPLVYFACVRLRTAASFSGPPPHSAGLLK